jgi:hypothetical protein
MKKLVSEELAWPAGVSLTGPVNEVISGLTSLSQKFPNHQNFRLIPYYEECVLWGDREETDEEYTYRLELEKKREARAQAKKEKKEKRERYLLERLKAKYG